MRSLCHCDLALLHVLVSSGEQETLTTELGSSVMTAHFVTSYLRRDKSDARK